MTDIANLVETYLRTWNEPDPAERRLLIDRLWTQDARYVDPLVDATGRERIAATIDAARAQFPGLVFTLVGAVDAHHDVARFSWALGPADGEPLVIGFDVAVVAGGRLRAVHGFLDLVPAA